MSSRVIVCGSRGWRDREFLEEKLDAVRHRYPGMLLVHGDCPYGADRMANNWARSRKVPIERHPANWKGLGKRAGFVRNGEMVRLGAALCVCFYWEELTPGTKDTMQKAREAGIETECWHGLDWQAVILGQF